MSEQKHTPEPWIVGRYGGIYSYRDGFVMGPMIVSGTTKSGTLPRYKENEDRIVECVNALAGIENPAEWVKNVKLGLADYEQLNDQLSKLRGENERLKAELDNAKFQAWDEGYRNGYGDGICYDLEPIQRAENPYKQLKGE